MLDCNFENSWNVDDHEPYILGIIQIKCVTLFSLEQVQDKGKLNVDSGEQKCKLTKPLGMESYKSSVRGIWN